MLRTAALILLITPFLQGAAGAFAPDPATAPWLLSATPESQEIDIEELLDRHTRARGGAAALEAVRSLLVELHVSEPAFAVDISYRAMRPDQARVDASVDGTVVFSEGVSGELAWELQPGEPPVHSIPAAAAALRHGARSNLYGLHEWRDLGYRMRLLPAMEIDGTSLHVMEVTSPDEQVEFLFFDPETYLVVRQRKEVALHPGVDPTEQLLETVYSDFRAIEGVMRPFRHETRDMRTGEQQQETTLTRIEVNPTLDREIFAMPVH